MGGVSWDLRETKCRILQKSFARCTLDGVDSGHGAEKTSACAVLDAFENPLFSVGASARVFGSHYWVGLQAPSNKSLAPCGYSYRFVKRTV